MAFALSAFKEIEYNLDIALLMILLRNTFTFLATTVWTLKSVMSKGGV